MHCNIGNKKQRERERERERERFSLKKTSYADGVRTGQITAILKLHDKNMTALFVCSGESKRRT